MKSLKSIIFDDLFRYTGEKSIKAFFIAYLKIPGFKYMVWFRIATRAREKMKLLYIPLWMKLHRLQYKFGYDIPAGTKIDVGFFIGHLGGIVITPKATIGKNCNISQFVTIGFSSRGCNIGYPSIKDNVYIGPGAVIIGNIIIGNNAAIGANAVVLSDVPDNAVVVGVPARIVSYQGSNSYILNKIK
jgi:serine O-acetyltransferase